MYPRIPGCAPSYDMYPRTPGYAPSYVPQKPWIYAPSYVPQKNVSPFFSRQNSCSRPQTDKPLLLLCDGIQQLLKAGDICSKICKIDPSQTVCLNIRCKSKFSAANKPMTVVPIILRVHQHFHILYIVFFFPHTLVKTQYRRL